MDTIIAIQDRYIAGRMSRETAISSVNHAGGNGEEAIAAADDMRDLNTVANRGPENVYATKRGDMWRVQGCLTDRLYFQTSIAQLAHGWVLGYNAAMQRPR